MMYLMLLLLRKYIITCYQTCLFVMWYVCSCGDCLQGENDKYIILTKKKWLHLLWKSKTSFSSYISNGDY